MACTPALDSHASRLGLKKASLAAALEWQVTLWSGEMDEAARTSWAQWLADDPANQKAWDEVQRMADRLQHVPAEVARDSLQRDAHPGRRQVLALLGLGAVGLLASRHGQVQHAVADYRSATGQQRQLDLPDGSQLKLNTASAVNLRFAHGRELAVLAGSEIALDTRGAGAGSSPFMVEMASMKLNATGSYAVMRDHGEQLQVSVLAGQLTLLAGPGMAAPTILQAGEQVWLSAGGIRRLPLNRSAALAWTRGFVQVERMPMSAFLSELGRYRQGLLYCDEDIAGMIVSGAFSVADTDFALQSMVQALPVKVHYRTPWLVRVAAA